MSSLWTAPITGVSSPCCWRSPSGRIAAAAGGRRHHGARAFRAPGAERQGRRLHVDGEIYIELEGSTPATMAKSLGFAVVEFSSEFQRLKPDVVMLIGDRYEALAAALAAAYMNICIVHIQGGEVSGSIDESARHAITNWLIIISRARSVRPSILCAWESHPESILGVGCPSSDIARMLVPSITSEMVNATGSGATIDINSPFLLVVFTRPRPPTAASASRWRKFCRPFPRCRCRPSCCGPTLTPAPTTSAKPSGSSATARPPTGCARLPIFLPSTT